MNDIFLKELFLENEKIIDKEIENVDFETEYGLTCEKMRIIKERIYKRIMTEIENHTK